MPLKSDSAPIGIWIGAGLAFRRSMIISTVRSEDRADAVHLIDETDARHAVLVGLTPHSLRLRLDAGDSVEHDDATVKHAQRALDFNGEVDVPRRVDDVDADQSVCQ